MDIRILAVYSGMAILLLAYIVSVVVRRDGEIWPAIDYWGVAAFEIVASLCVLAGARWQETRAIGYCRCCWASACWLVPR